MQNEKLKMQYEKWRAATLHLQFFLLHFGRRGDNILHFAIS
jgi:hypothetical protein